MTTAPEQMRAVIEGLQALRGVALVTAVTLVAEVGEFSRFAKPRQLMGYSGAVACEDSSGEWTWRGGITKTGNAHMRSGLTDGDHNSPAATALVDNRRRVPNRAVFS